LPRTFSEEEKQHIRNSLLEIAKESFSHYGLKKTNIEELTKAVGISKGAFYGFLSQKKFSFLKSSNRRVFIGITFLTKSLNQKNPQNKA